MTIQQPQQTRSAKFWLPGLILTGLCLSACTVDDDESNNFVTRTLSQSVAAASPIAVTDQYMAFPASEATTGAGGTDFNGDGDLIDGVMTVLNLGTDVVVQTGVAIDPAVGTEGMA